MRLDVELDAHGRLKRPPRARRAAGQATHPSQGQLEALAAQAIVDCGPYSVGGTGGSGGRHEVVFR